MVWHRIQKHTYIYARFDAAVISRLVPSFRVRAQARVCVCVYTTFICATMRVLLERTRAYVRVLLLVNKYNVLKVL